MMFVRVIESLRRPEYTGKNRCRTCTVVNLLIVGMIAVVLSAVSHVLFGIVAFVGGVIGIYLRGYLIPGTPTFTKHYFPPWLLRAFGKDPLEGQLDVHKPTTTTKNDVEPLIAAGVTTDETDKRTATSEFRSEWRDRIETVRDRGLEADDVRSAFDANSATNYGSLAFDLDGSRTVRWDTEAALVADVVASDLLQERVEEWSSFDTDQRQSVLLGLRLCLDVCPVCDSKTQTIEDRIDPCCQEPHQIERLQCPNCGLLANAAVPEESDVSIREELFPQ
jgi:hypothetical protein